jgi:hypothetical protein
MTYFWSTTKMIAGMIITTMVPTRTALTSVLNGSRNTIIATWMYRGELCRATRRRRPDS